MRALAHALLATLLLTAGCLGAAVDPAGTGAGADAVFSGTDVFPGRYATDKFVVAGRGPFAVGEQSVTLVPEGLGGADIMVYVMRPDVPEGTRVPVIVDAGPYFPPLQGVDLSDNPFLTAFVSHGFAFALVSVRGTGDSGGCMDLMGPAERHDVDQAVTWLGTQPWSNGNVGMFGGSYDGSTQWEAASTGNPHLKTIAPIAGIPDLHSFMVRNGSYMAWTPLQFGAVYWALYGPVLYNPATGRSAAHTAEQLVCPETMEGLAASLHAAATGQRDPLGFWAERDWRDEVLANYDGSVYLIHGFADLTVEPHAAYPFVKALEAKGLVVKHTLGPWGHELPWRGDALEALLRWYARWLKDDPTVDVGPKAQVLDNLGKWRSEPAWPPEDATPLALHLTPDRALAREPASGGQPIPVGASVPVQDPAALATRLNGPWKLWEDPKAEVCDLCARFETEPLAEDLRFAGAPVVRLALTPTGPQAHVTVLLHAVTAEGEWARVGMGMMDLRYAA
ncbi:MAG TPA: CocE/NonD family hydrolase, partial [Candidatus Thermoplasmatota archaeon]|nr:CocE/NonD family hydrolase [Candidatus Thermoplasmatota archaeon]